TPAWPDLHRADDGSVLRLGPGDEAEILEDLETEVAHLEVRAPTGPRRKPRFDEVPPEIIVTDATPLDTTGGI
ncbi:MAG: hypothetical protein ACRDYC_13085, partial [Acidimicrobiales bacterium]